MKTVFIVGEQRSGSNLLRLMLNQSKDLAWPHPPHLMQRFFPMLPMYGNLKDGANFRQLAGDICEAIRTDPVSWIGCRPEADLLLREAKCPTFLSLYEVAMDCFARSSGAQGWACKSMQNVIGFEEIERHFEKPLYIHLHRDPRDVCLSFKKAVIGSKHPFCVSRQWAGLQKRCFELQKTARDRYLRISYDSITSEPKEVISRLSVFLEIEFDADPLAFHLSEDARISSALSSLWENVGKPLIAGNSGKFASELRSEEVRVIEKVCADAMKELGYESRTSEEDLNSMEIEAKEVAEFERLDGLARREFLKTADKEDLNRRQRQERVFDMIKERLTLEAAS